METFKQLAVSIVYLCMMCLKDSLHTAAFELFLKYGIKSVSMDDISRKLGISKKTIYSFVATKEDLIVNILEKHLKKDEDTINDILANSRNAIDEMVNITRHVLSFLRSMTPSIIYDLKKYHPQTWEKIEGIHFSFIELTIYNNLLRGQYEEYYRADFDPRIISKLYVYKSRSIADQDKFPLDDFDRVLLFKEMIKYHLHGIVSEKGLGLIQQQHNNFLQL